MRYINLHLHLHYITLHYIYSQSTRMGSYVWQCNVTLKNCREKSVGVRFDVKLQTYYDVRTSTMLLAKNYMSNGSVFFKS